MANLTKKLPESKRVASDGSGGYYIGTAAPGRFADTDQAIWSVCHVDADGNTSWANGGFNKSIWDDRATLTYN